MVPEKYCENPYRGHTSQPCHARTDVYLRALLADSNAKHHGKWLSLVGLVAILASAAGPVLFTFGGEGCTTEMSRNPAPFLSESDRHRG
ncbi:MAG: hypothetical protein JWM45_1143 [Pseudonocardiales bacterium]|nr:hypothetical protein [Pseudonocardiales bacterium]